MLGEWLTRWSVRLAVAGYLVRLGIDAHGGRERDARLAWTFAAVFYGVHVVCAFHFVHGWSHAAAYEHTARQTAAATGFDFGHGIYVNFAFTLLWLVDLAGWWIGAAWRKRRGYSITVQAVFAFIVINATIVFGPPFWRWAAVAFAAILAAILLRRWA